MNNTTNVLVEAASETIKELARELGVTPVDIIVSVHIDNPPVGEPNAGLLIEHESDPQSLLANHGAALIAALY